MLRAAGFVIFRVFEGHIQYLLLRASYGDKHWTPPKGHVDPGESEWTTAIRETFEEAGLNETDLEIYKDVNKTLKYTVKNKDKTVIYWLAKLRNPNTKVQLSSEHTDLRWLNLEDAKKISVYKDLGDLLMEFHNHAITTI